MDTFGISDLRALTTIQSEPCVSIYLATHPSGQDGQQDPVRLKNLVLRAEEQVAGGWLRATEARELVQPIRDLSTDPAFWDQRSRGLAAFVSAGSFQRFRLAVEFDELAIVNRRYHVKPLFPLLSGRDRFFILSLSQNSVRLFDAARDQIEQVQVPGLPANMTDALNYTSADRGAQAHSAMRGGQGKQAAVFHGQGGQRDTRKEDLAAFARQVDAALKPVLRNQRAPLLLAGVDYVLSIYREVNHYPHVAKPQVEGNCDYLTPYEILQRAWPQIEPVVEQSRHRAATQYVELVSSGKTSEEIQQIIPAAREGRIDNLFVDVHAHQWGVFDPQSNAVELHEACQPGDEDLLDLAAVETLAHRGTVYGVPPEQMPIRKSIAALYRY
jgi:hypothetical protein